MEELEIIYIDEHIVAINKQSGLLVHRSLIDAVVWGYIEEEGVIDYPLKEVLDKMTDARVLDAMQMAFKRDYLVKRFEDS